MSEPLWTRGDKTAAALAVVCAAGYVVQPVETVVTTVLSGVLGPASLLLPFSTVVLVLGVASGGAGALARTLIRDGTRADRARERVEELRERLADADPSDETADLEAELREKTMTAMAEDFRPMVWSMLVSIPAFLWLRWVFTAPTAALAPAVVVIPAVGPVAWTATIVGPVKLWLLWYLTASFSTSFLARRVVDRLPVGS